MRAALYTRTGPAHDVLSIVELPRPEPYNLSAADRTRAIDGLTEQLDRRSLQHNFAARLPLQRIAEAHELVESGQAVGNVIVEVGDTE